MATRKVKVQRDGQVKEIEDFLLPNYLVNGWVEFREKTVAVEKPQGYNKTKE